ncbi:MAG: hypothetical protein JWQ43_631 [Glaciihabitans sp.]|nr:hypothetical protein [Glaciihabitans sp.]
MILTRVVPGSPLTVNLGIDGSRDSLVELYRPGGADWVRLNLIGSISGSAVGSDGTSETLTNPTDRLILRIIREHADVVVVGAESVRTEGFFVPRGAALAVVTGSGELGDHQVSIPGGRGPLVVLCPASAEPVARRTLGTTPATIVTVTDVDGRLTPAAILNALRELGYRSVVCEGGPSLAAQFVEAGVLDEICLTLAPVLNGSATPLLGGRGFTDQRLTLTQLLVDETSCLYARWSLAAT